VVLDLSSATPPLSTCPLFQAPLAIVLHGKFIDQTFSVVQHLRGRAPLEIYWSFPGGEVGISPVKNHWSNALSQQRRSVMIWSRKIRGKGKWKHNLIFHRNFAAKTDDQRLIYRNCGNKSNPTFLPRWKYLKNRTISWWRHNWSEAARRWRSYPKFAEETRISFGF